jgi:ketosteroid isomerase-like protein
MTESEQARIKAAKAAVKAKEIEWSNALRNGCSPSRTELAKTEIEKFLRENLTEDFTNIDYVGQLRTKKDDIKNCVGGDYKVKSLTKPVFVRVSIHGRCAVVVGKDEIDATYKGTSVDGNYIWTDIWVKSGRKWQCAAHQGSKL